MGGFEKLLDTVRKANLISEEDATTMLNDYNTAEQEKIDAAVDAASGSAFKEGYDQGFANARQQAEAEAKKNLDELLAKCDDDATNKLNTVIEMLNEDHAAKLQEVYNALTANTVPISELEAMDEDHAVKFEQAMKAVDEDHAKKFEEAMEAKDADCAKKLKVACESVARHVNNSNKIKYNNLEKRFNKYRMINEQKLEKNKFMNNKKLDILAESVEKFINYSLQKSIPSKALVSEAKYNASQKAIEKIGSILKINTILQESKEGVFKDYENKIADAKKESNNLMVENSNLKQQLDKCEAQILLESKIAKCTPAEATFLKSYFRNAPSKKIIEEQIEDARSAYNRLHKERRNSIVNNVKDLKKPSSVVNESKTVKKNEPSKKVVTEEKEKPASKPVRRESQSFADIYSEMLKNN